MTGTAQEQKGEPMDDTISRQEAIDRFNLIRPVDPKRSEYTYGIDVGIAMCIVAVKDQSSVQPEPREVVPHRNYQYLSDYWCECGWHLGKKGDKKYCPDCGRKVKWDG